MQCYIHMVIYSLRKPQSVCSVKQHLDSTKINRQGKIIIFFRSLVYVIEILRGPLHRTEIVGRSLSNQKYARSLNNLSKATKNLFLCEILVRSLISHHQEILAIAGRSLGTL